MTPKTSEKFEELYSRLNPAQKKAVDAIDGPVMVIAGPGTGKTSILTLRIGKILLSGNGTSASNILALTFTDAGAKEMRKRLRIIMGVTANEVRIHTYHGFAASIIAEYQDHFPHLFRTKQITEIEAEAMLREVLKEKRFSKLRPYGEPDFYVGKILGAIGDSKKEAWTPQMVKSFATDEIGRVNKDEASLSTRGPTKGKLKADALKRIEKCERTILFADVYEALEAKMRSEKKMDFNDLIIELISALRKDKLLLQLLQEKFLYILVDEHQDTNDSQNMLIRLIADFFENPNLFVVGDEKQAIYRFQGASVENFLKFKNAWKSMKTISLVENYRSHQSILDAGFAMIENNYVEGEHLNLRVRLTSSNGEEPRPIEVVTAGNTEAAEKYLMERVKKTEEKFTVAIIVRRNRDVERVLSVLEANGIPAAAERGADIFAHPVGALFFTLLEYLSDPSRIEALARTIAGGLWRLPFASRTVLIRKIRAGELYGIENDIPAIGKLQKEITRSGAIAYLTFAGEISGLTEIAARSPVSAQIWRAVIALASELARQSSVDDPRALMTELLSYKQSAEKRSIKIKSGMPDARVTVMTAHSSKGLEFDYVFLPYATKESWLPKGRGSYFVLPRERGEGDEERDARRLFYVALTRAKKHAVIISDMGDSQGKELSPLPFIEELDSKSVSKIDVPAVSENPVSQTVIAREERYHTELVEYAKRTLLEKGLSVTALNHFCNCPSEFYYKSILKLPEPPAGSAEKGNAMHEALAEVWHSQNRKADAATSIIQDVVKMFFARSLLPKFEKDPIVEELIADAPLVSTALEPHFTLAGTIATESWHETIFNGKYGDEAVSLNLHGKLDALVETENKVLVFDYKTREALSENAIKGLTKDSDGKYFRQLVFYRILLESDSKFNNKAIEPALVFVKPDSKGRCPVITLPVLKSDIERVKEEIQSLVESVWSGRLFTDICGEKDCEWCKLRQQL